MLISILLDITPANLSSNFARVPVYSEQTSSISTCMPHTIQDTFPIIPMLFMPHMTFKTVFHFFRGSSRRWSHFYMYHYSEVIMDAMASQITSLTIVYSTIYSGADQRKNQSYASLAFVLVIHRWPVNSPHKWPVGWEMFPFDDVIMILENLAWPFSQSGYRSSMKS